MHGAEKLGCLLATRRLVCAAIGQETGRKCGAVNLMRTVEKMPSLFCNPRKLYLQREPSRLDGVKRSYGERNKSAHKTLILRKALRLTPRSYHELPSHYFSTLFVSRSNLNSKNVRTDKINTSYYYCEKLSIRYLNKLNVSLVVEL